MARLGLLAIVGALALFGAMAPGGHNAKAITVDSVIQGDADCDRDVTPLDALHDLRYAGDPMDRAPCLGYGEVTCDDEINTDDVIALLRFSAGVSKNSICLPIGTTIVGDIISQGEATITGTYSADLDSGVFNQAQYENDLFWSQATETIRSLIGTNNARFASVNGRAYNAIDFPFLYGLLYTDDLIDGNDDATNELTNGSVCAVRTSGGNYAKVMVVAYGYNLTLDWVTYRPGK